MELFIAATALIVTCTALSAIEENILWMNSYKEAGEEDRQFQHDKQSHCEIEYLE